MEYIAYGFITLALLVELRNSVKGGKISISEEVKLRMLSTLLFLAGTMTYAFTEPSHLLLFLFAGMTAVSSWMLEISASVQIEGDQRK